MKECYEKVKLLGSGGMSLVWLVRQVSNGKYYAMKSAKQEGEHSVTYQQALHKEAHLLAGLHHSMIPALLKYEPMNYFIMEYIKGDSLEREVERKISDEQLQIWMKEVMEILSYLHQHGIYYLDLKPQNLIKDEQGHLHLIDFGVSVPMEHSMVYALTPRLRCS